MAYLDGQATAPEAMTARLHLAQCWDCSQDAEWTKLMKAALRRWGLRRPVELATHRLRLMARRLGEHS